MWDPIEARLIEDIMEINARLHHLQLLSPDPQACARFYGHIYGMQVESDGPGWRCAAPGRCLLFGAGPANRLGFAAFAFRERQSFEAFRRRVELLVSVGACRSPMLESDAFTVIDPDGNTLVFGMAKPHDTPSLQDQAVAPSARLQHFAVRSAQTSTLLPFYRDVLGFVVSDRVEDPSGRLRACFLRTDPEHHVIAIFEAPECRHDHLSFETTDWTALREWADRLSGLGIPLVWGVGRHGPGNDTFFMVHDPDQNLVEISAELEVCGPGRVEKLWAHEQRTLNLWGFAIMRS